MRRCLLLVCLGAWANTAFAGFVIGDVFASVGSGLVREFTPTGTLVQTLNTGTNSTFTAGSAFDAAGDLLVTTFASNVVSKFDVNGTLINGGFAGGFVTDPESITIAQNQNMFVGQADGTHQVREFSTSGSSGTLIATFSPAIESRGTDWIDLAADQHTLYYTSEGRFVHLFDTATNTQLANLNSVALPSANAFALRILANGGVLVADADRIVQLDATGAIVRQYTTANTFSGHALSTLFALNLDPDGTTFWTGDLGTGTIYRVNISTGALITSFSAGSGTLGGLSVFGEITQGGGGGGGTATPEPSSLVPLALMAIGAVVWRRGG